MRIRVACPDRLVNVGVIDAALEATTRANEALAARGLLPDLGLALRNGLRWRPEPWIGERFDMADVCARRGWGDCDDLGPWLAAQLRAAGEPARAFARKSGRNRYHVQVERGDGRILDPSIWAGMPSKSAPGKEPGAPQRPVAGPGESAIVAVPHGGRWHARADLPLTERIHVAGWGVARDPHTALSDAVAGYCAVAEGCHGVGDASVGFGLGDIVSAVAPLAGAAFGGPLGAAAGSMLGPMAGGVVNSVFGGGGGGGKGAQLGQPAPGQPAVASTAPLPEPPPRGWPSKSKTYAIPGPGGNSDGKVTITPGGGPIIVRF